MTVSDMVEMFWVQADRMSTFTSSGIEITIKGKKRTYEVMSSLECQIWNGEESTPIRSLW